MNDNTAPVESTKNTATQPQPANTLPDPWVTIWLKQDEWTTIILQVLENPADYRIEAILLAREIMMELMTPSKIPVTRSRRDWSDFRQALVGLPTNRHKRCQWLVDTLSREMEDGHTTSDQE